MVARNRYGTLYAERFALDSDQWVRVSRTPLSTPIQPAQVSMAGGSYDVMGQLVNHYKVHAAFSDTGILYAGSVIDYQELKISNEMFDHPVVLPTSIRYQKLPFVVGVDAEGRRLIPQISILGHTEFLFQQLITEGDRVFISGFVSCFLVN